MDSNHRPTDYESAALTAVLRARKFFPASAKILYRGAEASLEPFAVLKIDPKQAVGVTHGDGGPLAAQIPLHTHDLLSGVVEIGDVGHGHVLGYLLLKGEARLRSVDDAGHKRVGGVDLHAACAQKTLELTAGLLS